MVRTLRFLRLKHGLAEAGRWALTIGLLFFFIPNLLVSSIAYAAATEEWPGDRE